MNTCLSPEQPPYHLSSAFDVRDDQKVLCLSEVAFIVVSDYTLYCIITKCIIMQILNINYLKVNVCLCMAVFYGTLVTTMLKSFM